jgi:Golgi SNAP receptor complex protein 1
VTHARDASASFAQETLLGETATTHAGLISSTENASATMAIEIVDLLRELGEINERIAASLTEADRKHSTAALHAQQHHKGRLREYEKDFRTIRSNIEQAKAQAELLTTVRKDISAFKEGGSGRGEDVREALDGASDEMGRVLGSAMSNRAALQNQRTVVDQAMVKLKNTAALLPGVNNLMTRIRRRKARDLFVLAAVAAAFIVFLYLYGTRGK